MRSDWNGHVGRQSCLCFRNVGSWCSGEVMPGGVESIRRVREEIRYVVYVTLGHPHMRGGVDNRGGKVDGGKWGLRGNMSSSSESEESLRGKL